MTLRFNTLAPSMGSADLFLECGVSSYQVVAKPTLNLFIFTAAIQCVVIYSTITSKHFLYSPFFCLFISSISLCLISIVISYCLTLFPKFLANKNLDLT